MFKDYYEILGVTKEATEKDLKKSFRSLAMEFHPDSNDDPYAHQKFLDINEAYQILGDQLKRRQYDNRYEFLKRSKVNGNSSAYYSATQAYNYRPSPPRESRQQEFSRYATISRIIAYLALVFALTIVLDYFMAQTSAPETVLSGSLNQGPGGEMILRIKTDHQEFLLDYKHFEQLGKGDKASLRTTPIFGITTHLFVYSANQPQFGKLSDLYREELAIEPVYSFSPHYGIYNVFSFFLIGLLTASLMGAFVRNRPEFLFKLSLLNGLLIILTFFVLINS